MPLHQKVNAEPSHPIEAILRLVLVAGGLRTASLWSIDPAGAACCRHSAGQAGRSEGARRLARAVILGEAVPSSARAELVGVPVLRGGRPVAALVARAVRGGGAAAVALLEEAAPALAAIIERETPLARDASSDRARARAGERRLARLGFDLHDGPLQELILLGEDLAMFRGQLAVVLEGRRGKELLGGRLDDLDARLMALERGLRQISTAVHASALASRPFEGALEDLLAPFSERTGLHPELTLEGELDAISPSQRIALLAVVGEALNNVREHSGAQHVAISIAQDRDGVRARVLDDGRGFDVEGELLRAARGGHMGLAGLYERVGLLGGDCRVESRHGGPTEISLVLPRWEPAASQAEGQSPAPPSRRRAAARR